MLTTITFVAHPNTPEEKHFPSLVHALASSLDAGEAALPPISVGNSVSIEFANVDEVIRDIARNRAATYDMSRWELEGRHVEETHEGIMTADVLIQWIMDSIDMISQSSYTYDRESRRGVYSFSLNISGGYQFRERD